MLKGFEDAFVDAQANVISLCLELLKNSEKSADVIYVYILQMITKSILTHFLRKMASCSQPMIGVQMLKLRNSFIVE